MIIYNLHEYKFVNKALGREKIKMGNSSRWTQTVTDHVADTKVLMWETCSTAEESANLIIGEFCSIAAGVKFFLGGNHQHQRVSTFINAEDGIPAITSRGDINVGNDVWIGLGATILSGVTIGDGAIIGADAVVAKNVPAYAIVVGNPGKVISFRFTEDQVSRLKKLKWWEWNDATIEQHKHLLFNSDLTDDVLDELEAIQQNLN
jgi:chloramphenicol O-acetyltransferase type B